MPVKNGALIGLLVVGCLAFVLVFAHLSGILEILWDPSTAGGVGALFGLGALLFAVGFLPGAIARSKGRAFWPWWLYGVVLFPVALVHSLLLRPDRALPIERS